MILRRKEKAPRAQTTHDASFGPVLAPASLTFITGPLHLQTTHCASFGPVLLLLPSILHPVTYIVLVVYSL